MMFSDFTNDTNNVMVVENSDQKDRNSDILVLSSLNQINHIYMFDLSFELYMKECFTGRMAGAGTKYCGYFYSRDRYQVKLRRNPVLYHLSPSDNATYPDFRNFIQSLGFDIAENRFIELKSNACLLEFDNLNEFISFVQRFQNIKFLFIFCF